MSTEIVRFLRLNNVNYPTWSITMEAELIRKDLWGVVDIVIDTTGKSESEIATALATALAARKPTDMASARAEMILRVEPSQLYHMRSRDPREIWKSLKSVHSARGFATTLALRREFLTAKKADDQSMQAWIGDVQGRAYIMEDAGLVVTEMDKILALTMGLPPVFDPVIINFDSMPSDQLTFEHVIVRLLNEEQRQTSSATATAELAPKLEKEVAFAARTANRSRRPLSEITCFKCQKKGHYQSTCPDNDTAGYADAEEIW